MKQNIIKFLCAAFPFLLSIGLWRLSIPILNPAGMLALIPVFFCTFVMPVPWFAPFAVMMCFLVDYKFASPFIWTVLWCLFYAVNGFQTFIDLTRMEYRALYAFAAFVGIGIIILLATSFGWAALWRACLSLIFIIAMYMPITALIQRIGDD